VRSPSTPPSAATMQFPSSPKHSIQPPQFDQQEEQQQQENSVYIATSTRYFQNMQDTYMQLVSECEADVPLSDVIFELPNERRIYTCKAILVARSEYFCRMFKNQIEPTTIDMQSKSNWIANYPDVFLATLQYLCTNIVPSSISSEPHLALIMGLYAEEIDLRQLANFTIEPATKFLKHDQHRHYKDIETVLQMYIFLTQNSKKFSMAIQSYVSDLTSKLYRTIMNNASQVFKCHEVAKLASKELILEILEKGKLTSVEEADIFQLMLAWAKTNNFTNRQEYEDMLQHIYFEKFTAQQVNNILVPSNIFSDSEILQFFKLVTLHPLPFTIMGKEYNAIRSRVASESVISNVSNASNINGTNNSSNIITPQKPTSSSTHNEALHFQEVTSSAHDKIVFSFTLNLRSIKQSNNMLITKPFTFQNCSWYLCFIAKHDYFSVYIYNADIESKGPLSEPLLIATTFKLNNQEHNEEKSAKFKASWQHNAAWGVANFAPIRYLKDEKLGFIHGVNKQFTFDVKLTLLQ